MREEPEGFQRFWAAYPRRLAKLAALKAWQALKPTPATVETMLEALAWQARSRDWTKDGGQFVPYPATWLRAGRWMDERPRTAHAAVYEPWVCPHTPECRHRAACTIVAMRKHA